MSRHLSSQQIDSWMAGDRPRDVERHLRDCAICDAEVREIESQLTLLRGAVRSWGVEENVPQAEKRHDRRAVGWRWRTAVAAAALFAAVAVPVYRSETRREQLRRQSAQDELLLRQVEAQIARPVPTPMEPLARLWRSEQAWRHE